MLLLKYQGAFWFVFLMFGGQFSSLLLTYYLLFYTRFYPIVLLYIAWTLTVDKDTHEKGGKYSPFIRNLYFWKTIVDYFPIKVHTNTKNLSLDENKNYLFACYPHGVLPAGPSMSAVTHLYTNIFPNHRSYAGTLRIQFWTPFIREIIFGLGVVSVTRNSLNYLLSKKSGKRNIVSLIIGGAEESAYSKPGTYKLVIKNRKGFIKLALKNKSPIVPVFTFGETDVYDQFEFRKGSFLRNFQEWVKSKTGVMPVFLKGLNYFPVMPRKVPINVVIGNPIDVDKILNDEKPTQELIDALHTQFMEELEKLFESEKHKYLGENAGDIKLEFV